MNVFLELLLPTMCVSLALLGLLCGYSSWLLLGGSSSEKKTVKGFAVGTSSKDPGIPQWLLSLVWHIDVE